MTECATDHVPRGKPTDGDGQHSDGMSKFFGGNDDSEDESSEEDESSSEEGSSEESSEEESSEEEKKVCTCSTALHPFAMCIDSSKGILWHDARSQKLKQSTLSPRAWRPF